MELKKKKFTLRNFNCLLLLVSFISTLFVPQTNAATHTVSDYVVTYSLTEGQRVSAQYKITETNTSSDQSIISRTLTIPGDVSSANARIGDEGLSTDIKQEGGTSVVTTYFNNRYFGKGRQIVWNLDLTLDEEIEISGSLKYFYLRGYIKSDNVRSYTAYVIVPNVVESLNYISTDNYEVQEHQDQEIYKFEESVLSEGPVLFIFGDYQAYMFNFNYAVDSGYEVELVVPPDRDNQEIYYTGVSPSPTSAYVDDDGNYRLSYKTNDTMEQNGIQISGIAVVQNASKDRGSYEPPANLSDYLGPDDYWESDATSIKKRADTITKGIFSNYDKAQAIYAFVKDHLEYSANPSLANRERLGAQKALSQTTDTVCQEFSDLFIALARASDVPAREVAGYSEDLLSESSDELVLHSWVEFWDDSYGWVMADPTWANNVEGNYFNNVGSDHLALVVRGIDSISPSIVTSFMETDDPTDNILLEPTTIIPVKDSNAEISIDSGHVTARELPLFMKNTGNTALRLSDLDVTVGGLNFDSDRTDYLVLPGTSQRAEVPIDLGFIWKKETKQVEIEAKFSNYLAEVLTENISASVTINPVLPWMAIFISGSLALALLAFFAIKWIRR